MPFEFVAGNPALDFVNTVHNHGAGDPEDDLQAWPDLLQWGRESGLLSPGESEALFHVEQARARKRLRAALELRETVFEMFDAAAHGNSAPAEVMAQFNGYLAVALSRLQVDRKRGGYRMAWRAGSDPGERMLGEIVRAAAELLTSEKLERVRECAGESCTWLFLDTSRNGKRRWCDMQACGNRAKVRRYRQRAG